MNRVSMPALHSGVACLVALVALSSAVAGGRETTATVTGAALATTASRSVVELATTSTRVQPVRGDAVTTPVDGPGAAEREWRERLRKAVLADDYRESTAAVPVHYRELEFSTATRRRARRGAESRGQYVPTTQAVNGPMGRQPTGPLSGRIVFVSPGHGWTNELASGLWYTQRPLCFGMVEDFGNLDQANLFADLCFRAGATIVPMRPLGHQPIERVVDNARPATCHFQGPWCDSNSPIFHGPTGGRPVVPYRFAVAAARETAVARFRPYLPENGFYPVYCWARDGADRINQLYRIVHAGGATEVRVNHRMIGKGWVYLGEYYFEKGSDGYVEVSNLAATPRDADGRHVVIADAVRFGNGMGSITRGGGISGRPREEEAARYWAEASLAGAAPPVYDAFDRSDQDNNVGTPPRLAAHMNREKEGRYLDRVYLGFHSNAVGGRGVVGLFEKDAEMRPDMQVEYARIIADEMNREMTRPGVLEEHLDWVVGRKLTASHINFGEIRRDYGNNEMVSTLNEVAFHDNERDAALLRTPGARMAFARASLRGILRFLREMDKQSPPQTMLPPEAPVLLDALTSGADSVTLRWAAAGSGDAASGYRVYRSDDGLGFDGGVDARGTTTLTIDRLSTGTAHHFRVTAVGQGGESLPSRTLNVALQGDGAPRVLLVSAFNKVREEHDLVQVAESGIGSQGRPGGEFVRIVPRMMDPGMQLVPVCDALTTLGVAYDSCGIEGLGTMKMSGYDAVMLMCGLQSSRDGIFTTDLQSSVSRYLEKGGRLVVSGSNVLESLDGPSTRPTAAMRAFARRVLRAGCAETSVAATGLRGARRGALAGAACSFDTGDRWLTRNLLLDALKPAGAARTLVTYDAPGEPPAAAVYGMRGKSGGVAVFGFPLESVRESEARTQLLRAALGLPEPPVARKATTSQGKTRRTRRGR